MIEYLPCGCPTTPINLRHKLKQKLLAGETIIMDDPMSDDFPILFMQYKNLEAFSVLEFPDETQMVAQFDFHKALEICLEHWDKGWDCCYGHLTFINDGEEITFGH